MSLLLEFLHEHALSIDFAMFVLIGLVQVIVYPVFREIPVGDDARSRLVVVLARGRAFVCGSVCEMVSKGEDEKDWGTFPERCTM